MYLPTVKPNKKNHSIFTLKTFKPHIIEDVCSAGMSSLFNFSYFPEELIKFNNLWFSKRNLWNSIHETFTKCCFTIIIVLIVSTRNLFFSSFHKTLVNENISTDALVPGIAIEYFIIVVTCLMEMSIFSDVLNISYHLSSTLEPFFQFCILSFVTFITGLNSLKSSSACQISKRSFFSYLLHTFLNVIPNWNIKYLYPTKNF